MQGEGEGRAPPSASPKHRSIVNSSQRCLSGMEALKEDRTSATTIIVWDRPGHLCESQPAPLPLRACSLLSPAPTRPARFVCATTAASLVAEGAEKTRKRAGNPAKTLASNQRVPRVLRVHKKLPPFSAHHRAPILPSLRIIPVHPALSSIPPCHDASGLELALSHRRKAP